MSLKLNNGETLMKKITKLIIIAVIIYVIITLINQQKILNSYKNTQGEIAKQIKQAKEYGQELEISKENANSLSYIEQVAREKLNMYYPNERIYIDSSK